MITIDIQIEPNTQTEIDEERLIGIVESTLQICFVQQAELTVSITSDSEIQSLNAQYRGLDKPTDVLSFDALNAEDDFILPEGM